MPPSREPLPKVFGCELSGVVTSVGAGVSRLRAGDEVFTRVAKDRLGAFAETACVHEDLVAKKPASLDFVHAAAVPLAALTALQALRDELTVKPGMRIFIPGDLRDPAGEAPRCFRCDVGVSTGAGAGWNGSARM